MGSTPRKPKGGLPAPPRRNLVAGTVKDSVRKSLAGPPETRLAPEDIQELLRRVAMEEARSPGEGSIEPYLAALRELPGQEGLRILTEAFPEGVPDVFASIQNPMDLGSLDDMPEAPLVDFSTLTPSQQRAARQVVELVSAYERARKEFAGKFGALTPEQQGLVDPEVAVGFDQSEVAKNLRAKIYDTVIMADLDPGGVLTGNEPVGYVGRALAPELSDLPEPEGTQRVRATRADIPVGEKLSTYMGDRANDFIVKDEPLTGGRVGNLQKLSGAQMRKMLVLAGWSPDEVKNMNAAQLVARTTAYGGEDGMTSKVASPTGELVEITIPPVSGKRKSGRAGELARMQETLTAMEKMPPVKEGTPAAVARQQRIRQSTIAQLKEDIAKLQSKAISAKGDTLKAQEALQERIAEISELPVDPEVGPLDHLNTQGKRGFEDGGPEAVRDEDTRQSLITYLRRQLSEMQARMSARQPTPAMPTQRVGELKATGGNPNAMRSPAQVKAEQWLSASGAGTTETSGLTSDPVTGERMVLGGEQYFQEAADAKEPPKIPGFLYAAAPSVDASGSVTHSGQPLDPRTAAQTIGWTLGAQDPGFASAIESAVGEALDRDFRTVPTGNEPGRTVFNMGQDQQSRRPMIEVRTPAGLAYREQMMPGPTGLAYLQGLAQQQGGMSGGLAGGGAGGGRIQVEVARRPSQMIDDSRAPTISELMAMPIEDPPNSPPPTPGTPEAMTLEQLDATSPEGDMEGVLGPDTPATGRPSPEDINRMLEEIQLGDDDTGFLRQTSMNRVPRSPVLSGLLA